MTRFHFVISIYLYLYLYLYTCLASCLQDLLLKSSLLILDSPAASPVSFYSTRLNLLHSQVFVMEFNARGGVSILELCIFFPSLIGALLICHRHGFNRSSGWIFTLILCLVRVIGACCQLATYHDLSSGLIKTTIILDSVGLSPLLLATLGLLSRW